MILISKTGLWHDNAWSDVDLTMIFPKKKFQFPIKNYSFFKVE